MWEQRMKSKEGNLRPNFQNDFCDKKWLLLLLSNAFGLQQQKPNLFLVFLSPGSYFIRCLSYWKKSRVNFSSIVKIPKRG
jgi:hypothetical protein